MVSNLLVVLCSEHHAQPVLNAGTSTSSKDGGRAQELPAQAGPDCTPPWRNGRRTSCAVPPRSSFSSPGQCENQVGIEKDSERRGTVEPRSRCRPYETTRTTTAVLELDGRVAGFTVYHLRGGRYYFVHRGRGRATRARAWARSWFVAPSTTFEPGRDDRAPVPLRGSLADPSSRLSEPDRPSCPGPNQPGRLRACRALGVYLGVMPDYQPLEPIDPRRPSEPTSPRPSVSIGDRITGSAAPGGTGRGPGPGRRDRGTRAGGRRGAGLRPARAAPLERPHRIPVAEATRPLGMSPAELHAESAPEVQDETARKVNDPISTPTSGRPLPCSRRG